jgi:hypothetical protein
MHVWPGCRQNLAVTIAAAMRALVPESLGNRALERDSSARSVTRRCRRDGMSCRRPRVRGPLLPVPASGFSSGLWPPSRYAPPRGLRCGYHLRVPNPARRGAGRRGHRRAALVGWADGVPLLPPLSREGAPSRHGRREPLSPRSNATIEPLSNEPYSRRRAVSVTWFLTRDGVNPCGFRSPVRAAAQPESLVGAEVDCTHLVIGRFRVRVPAPALYGSPGRPAHHRLPPFRLSSGVGVCSSPGWWDELCRGVTRAASAAVWAMPDGRHHVAAPATI